MTTVFLDESGDLGFDLTKTRTSRNFVVAILVCSDVQPMDKLVRQVFRGFSKTDLKHHHGVLHAYSENETTRRKILSLLVENNVGILIIRLDKNRAFFQQNEKHLLYNSIVNVILDRLISRGLVSANETVHVVASQRETSHVLNANFMSYLTSKAVEQHGVRLDVQIKPTSAEKGLQIVDCLSWSFFRKYEHNDSTYADLVASRVIEESSVFD